MARQRQSLAEANIDLTAKFPWWIGLLPALMAYVAVHRIASQGIPQGSGWTFLLQQGVE